MLNIGPEKLLLLFVVALVVLGPEELPKAARQLGRVMAILREVRDRAESEVRSYANTIMTPPADGQSAVASGPPESPAPSADPDHTDVR